MNKSEKIGAIILAGGKSSRMGKDKALLAVNGKTLLQNALRICASFTPTLISSNNPKHQINGVKLVPDEFLNSGPLAGIHSGLKHTTAHWNLVLSVDSPQIQISTINALMENLSSDKPVVAFCDQLHPLIGFYPKSILPFLSDYLRQGKRSVKGFLHENGYVQVDFSTELKNQFYNINTPQELQEIQ